MPLLPAGDQWKGSLNCHRQRFINLYLLAVEYLLSCENSKYYLSLKFNTVLLPETTLYSSLPRSL